MARRCRAGVLCTLGICLLAGPLYAYEIRILEAKRIDKRFTISLVARLELPIDAVYRKLTNFDKLTHLSGSIEESRRLKPDEAGEIIVYTRLRPCVLFVCRTVRIFETISYPAKYQIVATVIAARSELAYGDTHWTLSPEGNGTLLEYKSEIEPGFDMFPWVGPAAAKYSMKKQARELLEGLER